MEHLTDFVFINLANTTLLRRDSYLQYLKAGMKADTLNALRTAPLQLETLFPDTVIKCAEEEISSFYKGRSASIYKKRRYHPYEREDTRSDNRKQERPAWKNLSRGHHKKGKGKQQFSSRPAKGQQLYKGQSLCTQSTATTAGRGPTPTTKTDIEHSLKPKCKLSCCHRCLYCPRAFTKERYKSWGSRLSLEKLQIKICEKCFLCHSIVLCKSCLKCYQCCYQICLNLGAGPKIVQILREGYTLPFRIRPNLTRSPTVVSRYVNPHRNSYLLEALHQLIDKNAVELVHNQTSLGFFNRLFLVPKPNNKWRPILDLSKLNLFLKVEKFKMETPETIRTYLQQGEWVTSVDFKDAYFHIPIQEQSRKYLRFHAQGRTYQFKALPFGLSTAPMEFTVLAKEVKLMAIHKGIRIHQYLDDWLMRARSQQTCLQHTQILVKMCQDLGWLVNLEKSELEPKQVFDFVGYQFDLRSGRVKPTPDRWQSLQDKIQALLLLPACPDRQFMSLIGLLTATEKQVHLGRLHMRPIQWHLKNNWRVPESLEKVIPLPRSLHPHLQWWLEEDNVLQGQPLHPIKHALQIFTDASKEGWGAHLNEFTARGSWSVPESKLHINYLELKTVFLALKEFQNLCVDKIVLVATDNTTVVAYINKEGGMRSGPLCALLWRILTWCSQRQVTLKARHIPGRLNVIADKLSRLGQTIQTEWSLLPEVFQQICNQWHRPQIDLFATRFNHKLPQFVSPVPDSLAVAVDALTLPWKDLDAYAFPPTAILGKVVEKLLDSPCKRLILIAPGWANMPWFWDLVNMSSQVPLILPNLPSLLTQPFNQIPHRNLTNLNLHAWLLEPQKSKNRASLRQWQQELRLLKEDLPDQSMRQSGPFLQSGASLIRWTSGHHL